MMVKYMRGKLKPKEGQVKPATETTAPPPPPPKPIETKPVSK